MSRAILIILLWLFSLHATCQIQNTEITKLQHELSQTADSLRQVDLMCRISFLFYERNIDSTFSYIKQARLIAERHNYKKGIADGYNCIGIVYDVKGYLALAISFYNKAHKAYTELADVSNQVQTLMNMAMVYNTLGNEQKTRFYFNKAFEVGRNLNNDSILSIVYFNYLLINEHNLPDDSIHYYTSKATAIATKYADTRALIALSSISAAHMIHTGKVKEGVSALENAITQALDQQLYFASLDMIITVADHLMPLDSAKALQYYELGLNISKTNAYVVYERMFTEKLYHYYSRTKDVLRQNYYAALYIKALENEQKIDNTSAIDYTDYALKEEELALTKVRGQIRLVLLILMSSIVIAGGIFLIVIRRNLLRTKKLNKLIVAQNVAMQQTLTDLEQSHAENTRMMKIVAHDLRGPAAGVYNLAEILLETPQRNPEDIKMLQLIKDSTEKLLLLTEELLVNKAQSNELKKEALDIGQLLQQSVGLFTATAKEKAQTIQLQASSIFIFASREKLWRVLSNIIANAIKFSPSGAVIDVILQDQQDTVLISVKDYGIGIPEVVGKTIFHPYPNTGRSGTQGEQSFGMGMAISKQIVEAHKGKIWFEANPEGGTIFYVQLPKQSLS